MAGNHPPGGLNSPYKDTEGAEAEQIAENDMGHHLLVGNLDAYMDEAWLREQFSAFGTITGVIVVRSNGRFRGYAFVSYGSVYDAYIARVTMNGKKFGSRCLYVNFVHSNESGGDGGDNVASQNKPNELPTSLEESQSSLTTVPTGLGSSSNGLLLQKVWHNGIPQFRLVRGGDDGQRVLEQISSTGESSIPNEYTSLEQAMYTNQTMADVQRMPNTQRLYDRQLLPPENSLTVDYSLPQIPAVSNFQRSLNEQLISSAQPMFRDQVPFNDLSSNSQVLQNGQNVTGNPILPNEQSNDQVPNNQTTFTNHILPNASGQSVGNSQTVGNGQFVLHGQPNPNYLTQTGSNCQLMLNGKIMSNGQVLFSGQLMPNGRLIMNGQLFLNNNQVIPNVQVMPTMQPAYIQQFGYHPIINPQQPMQGYQHIIPRVPVTANVPLQNAMLGYQNASGQQSVQRQSTVLGGYQSAPPQIVVQSPSSYLPL